RRPAERHRRRHGDRRAGRGRTRPAHPPRGFGGAAGRRRHRTRGAGGTGSPGSARHARPGGERRVPEDRRAGRNRNRAARKRPRPDRVCDRDRPGPDCRRAAGDRGTMSGPLDGLTIVDLTRVLSGPYCTMVLADLGARVIKVEHPGHGDDTRQWGPPFVGPESAYFLSINRNKESVTVDFKHPQGREVLSRLVARADVLVENFKPGTLDRAGFGWEALHGQHPRL